MWIEIDCVLIPHLQLPTSPEYIATGIRSGTLLVLTPNFAGVVFDGFPFPPYPIQQDFMGALYKVLSEGGVGLFESPTGRSQGSHCFAEQQLVFKSMATMVGYSVTAWRDGQGAMLQGPARP